jgi:hypothetical protein
MRTVRTLVALGLSFTAVNAFSPISSAFADHHEKGGHCEKCDKKEANKHCAKCKEGKCTHCKEGKCADCPECKGKSCGDKDGHAHGDAAAKPGAKDAKKH